MKKVYADYSDIHKITGKSLWMLHNNRKKRIRLKLEKLESKRMDLFRLGKRLRDTYGQSLEQSFCDSMLSHLSKRELSGNKPDHVVKLNVGNL